MQGWTFALQRFGGQSLTAPTRASTFQFDLSDALWQHRGDIGGVYPRCAKHAPGMMSDNRLYVIYALLVEESGVVSELLMSPSLRPGSRRRARLPTPRRG